MTRRFDSCRNLLWGINLVGKVAGFHPAVEGSIPSCPSRVRITLNSSTYGAVGLPRVLLHTWHLNRRRAEGSLSRVALRPFPKLGTLGWRGQIRLVGVAGCVKRRGHPHAYASVAQSVERHVEAVGVAGSSPAGSTWRIGRVEMRPVAIRQPVNATAEVRALDPPLIGL